MLELASNISQLLDFVLLLIGFAITGYGLKVKFIAAAEKRAERGEKKALEIEAKHDKLREDFERHVQDFNNYRVNHAERWRQDRDDSRGREL